MAAIAAPDTDSAGLGTSSHCNTNFTAMATAMESAAYFARPMPVRQDESVCTPESVAAETAEILTSETRSAASSAERWG